MKKCMKPSVKSPQAAGDLQGRLLLMFHRPVTPRHCSPRRSASSHWRAARSEVHQDWSGWRCCSGAPGGVARIGSLGDCHSPQRCCAHHQQSHSQSPCHVPGRGSWTGWLGCSCEARRRIHGYWGETIETEKKEERKREREYRVKGIHKEIWEDRGNTKTHLVLAQQMKPGSYIVTWNRKGWHKREEGKKSGGRKHEKEWRLWFWKTHLPTTDYILLSVRCDFALGKQLYDWT